MLDFFSETGLLKLRRFVCKEESPEIFGAGENRTEQTTTNTVIDFEPLKSFFKVQSVEAVQQLHADKGFILGRLSHEDLLEEFSQRTKLLFTQCVRKINGSHQVVRSCIDQNAVVKMIEIFGLPTHGNYTVHQ